MQMQDSWKWGFIPAQHHGFNEENLPTDQRHILQAVRVKKRFTGDDELVEYDIVDESGGDDMGRHLWIPECEGAGTFPLQRWVSGWRHSWPSVAHTQDDQIRLNRVEEDPVPSGLGSRGFSAFPIFKGDYKADLRYAREVPSIPEEDCFSKVAGGRIGIIMSATKEDEQVPLWMDCDSRIIAAHFAGDPLTGTLVADTNADDEIDPLRCARFQSLARVIKEPTGCKDTFPKNPDNSKQANALAWNLAVGGLGDVKGGLVIDRPTSGGGGAPSTPTPGDSPPVNPPTPTVAAGSGGGAPTGPGATTTSEPGTTVTNGAGMTQTAPSPSARVIGMASQHESGPFVVGDVDDQHKIGVDADGNPINSLHLSVNAYFFRGKNEDAPLFFEGEFNHIPHVPPVLMTNAPFSHPVLLEIDPKETHGHLCNSPTKMWKWRAGSFFYIPEDPRVPDPGGRATPDPDPGGGGQGFPPGGPTSAPGPGGPGDVGGLAEPLPVEPPEFPTLTSVPAQGGPGFQEPAFTSVPAPGGPGFIEPGSRAGVTISEPAPIDWLLHPTLLPKDRRQWRNIPYVSCSMDLSMPSLMGRPQYIRRGVLDFRNWRTPGLDDIIQMDRETPIVIRSEFYGAQKAGIVGGFTNDPWDYTERPGLGRWIGGTAAGGEAFMPPELDMADIGTAVIVPVNSIDTITNMGSPNLSKSDVYKVAVADGAFWAVGLPSLEDGGIRLGFRWGGDLQGNAAWDCVDKDGAQTRLMTFLRSCVLRIERAIELPVLITTAPVTLGEEHHTVKVTNNAHGITLPSVASAPGRIYEIKHAVAGSVRVTPDGTDTIDGSAFMNITGLNSSQVLKSDGISDWMIF